MKARAGHSGVGKAMVFWWSEGQVLEDEEWRQLIVRDLVVRPQPVSAPQPVPEGDWTWPEPGLTNSMTNGQYSMTNGRTDERSAASRSGSWHAEPSRTLQDKVRAFS